MSNDPTNSPQPELITPEAVQQSPSHKKLYVAITLAVVITALVVGGGVYAWQKSVQRQRANHIKMAQISTLPTAENIEVASATPTLVTDDSIKYAMVNDPETGIDFPTITDFQDPVIKAKVNAQLSQTAQQFNCFYGETIADLREDLKFRMDDGSGSVGQSELAAVNRLSESELKQRLKEYIFYGVTVQVQFAAKDIFSLEINNGSYCGGAHPSNDTWGLTFDMKTGELVPIEKLFTNYETDKSKIIESIFADIPRITVDPSSTACVDVYDVNELVGDESASLTYFISNEGLAVQPEVPYAVAACVEPVYVPLNKIQPFISPQSILNRLQ